MFNSAVELLKPNCLIDILNTMAADKTTNVVYMNSALLANRADSLFKIIVTVSPLADLVGRLFTAHGPFGASMQLRIEPITT